VLAVLAGSSTLSNADTGALRVVMTKGGFIVGAGGGTGMLTFRGHHYPLRIGGVSLGVTAGVSKTRWIGRAYHLQDPADIVGTYGAVGSGGAFGVGEGRVQLQNARGVLLELKGRKIGLEFSAALSGLRIGLR